MSLDFEAVRAVILGRVTISDSGCWEWNLKLRPNGYARVTYKQKSYYAHRLSYMAFNSVFLDFGDSDICHKCDNRKCCNPDHLFRGTRIENMQDAMLKNRLSAGDRHSRLVRGEKSGQSKLKEHQVIRIRAMRDSGSKLREIAELFGIDKTTVSIIAKRKAWRHLNG